MFVLLHEVKKKFADVVILKLMVERSPDGPPPLRLGPRHPRDRNLRLTCDLTFGECLHEIRGGGVPMFDGGLNAKVVLRAAIVVA